MAHESMVRTLAAQAAAIWPQERPLLGRYALPDHPAIIDVACGTGEITARLAEMFPTAQVLGVDLLESHLVVGRHRCAEFGERVRFAVDDAFALSVADGSFDLAVCRHLFQAVPEPGRVLDELIRIVKPGGRLHILAEDYAQIHFHPTPRDTDQFWHDGPITFGETTGTDLRIGRKTAPMCAARGLQEITVDYLVVDTLRVPRETIEQIWLAWRDGYTDILAAHTAFSRTDIWNYWQEMLACIRDPHGYMAWHVPVISAVKPLKSV